MMKLSSFSYCCVSNFSKYSTNMLQDNKMRGDTVSLPLEYTNMDPCDKVGIRERQQVSVSRQNKYFWEQQWAGTHFKLEWRKLKQRGAEINKKCKVSGKSQGVQPFWN